MAFFVSLISRNPEEQQLQNDGAATKTYRPNDPSGHHIGIRPVSRSQARRQDPGPLDGAQPEVKILPTSDCCASLKAF